MSIKLAIVGAGHMSSGYVLNWCQKGEATVVAIVDTAPHAAEKLAALTGQQGDAAPALFSSVDELIEAGDTRPDAAYIATPHAAHAQQAISLIRAGVDVLLEKPMVTAAEDAETLAALVTEKNATLVVAFQGAMSSLVQETQQDVANKTFGALQSVSGNIWENWKDRYVDSWKQVASLSGGGFMFDTGAHMMNTMLKIVGSDVKSIAAIQSSLDRNVDVLTTTAGEFDNGVLFTLNANGNIDLDQCKSEITLFFESAIVKIDAWGRWRETVTVDDTRLDKYDVSNELLATFCAIRNGSKENFSDVHQGVRFARLWDAIVRSAQANGQQISLA